MSSEELRTKAMQFYEEWKNNSVTIKSLLDDIEHNCNIKNSVDSLMIQSFITGIEFGVHLSYMKTTGNVEKQNG